MDEAPVKPIEKKNAATKRTRVCFTIIASLIFGEGRHLREAHGNIKKKARLIQGKDGEFEI
jgi:hypothetical protein